MSGYLLLIDLAALGIGTIILAHSMLINLIAKPVAEQMMQAAEKIDEEEASK